MNIVLEVKGKRAVLLDDNGRMQIVRNRNYSVGQSVAYNNTNTIYRTCAAVACAAAVMFCSVAGYHCYFTAAAYLSVDINPSIQLEINRFERVIDAEAFNDEGNIILDSVRLKNGDVKAAIEKIIAAAKENGYLTAGDNGVIVDIASERTDIINNISGIISEYTDKDINIVMEQSTNEDVEMSKSLNVSIGRIKTLREYSGIFGGDIEENQEALKESSVKELREKNQQKTEEKADKDNKDNKGNDDNNNTEQYTGEKDNTDKIKASAKSDKETEKQAETKQKNVEEAEKEAEKQAEEAKKEAEKRAEAAEKREEEAEKQAEEAKKEAEKRAEAAEKEAEKREEEAEKEAQKRAKESEKAAEKSDKNK